MVNWLYEDIIFLRKNGRKKSCLLLLLCLVDSLSKKDRDIGGNRAKYISYLKSRLRSMNMDKSIRVEEKGKLLHLADIIYKYFRCNIVHDGDDREDEIHEVQIEYDKKKGFMFDAGFLMDLANKKIIFKIDWLIDTLLEVVKKDV